MANNTHPATSSGISSSYFININWKVYELNTPSTPQVLQPTYAARTPRYTNNSNYFKYTFPLKYANGTNDNSELIWVWKQETTELHFNPSTYSTCNRQDRWSPRKKKCFVKNYEL